MLDETLGGRHLRHWVSGQGKNRWPWTDGAAKATPEHRCHLTGHVLVWTREELPLH